MSVYQRIILCLILISASFLACWLWSRQNEVSTDFNVNDGISQDNGRPPEANQAGGGEYPPDHLIIVLNDLPQYPGVTARDGPMAEPVRDGGRVKLGVLGFYWTNDTPEQVADFYNKAFAVGEWQKLEVPLANSDENNLNAERSVSVFARAVHANVSYRVQVMAGPSAKTYDPRGRTEIKVLLSTI